MGLCFCSRPSMGMSPSDDERHPLPLSLSAMPAAPRPVRLPRHGAESSPVPPSTPPRVPHMHDGASSPRQPSVHCPIPRIPDFEGLADSETDSDDELSHLARLRASGNIVAASPVPSMSVSSAAGPAEGSSLSPLSSLITRIGSIGRTSPIRPAHPCRTPEAAYSTGDLAAAAHRAEVRRLMHKMMQDELQNERQQQQQLQQAHPPRTYKRSSMSTIKEDPGDGSNIDLHAPSSVLATMDGSGPSREALEYAFTKSKEDLSLPSILTATARDNGKFVLPKPPTLPVPAASGARRGRQGMRGRARVPPVRGLKDSVPSLSTGQSDEVSSSSQGQLKLQEPASGTVAKFVSSSAREADSHTNSLRIKRVSSRDNDSPRNKADPLNEAVSGSLSSIDDEGSIHEAREARVISSDKLRSASGRHRKEDAVSGNKKSQEFAEAEISNEPPARKGLLDRLNFVAGFKKAPNTKQLGSVSSDGTKVRQPKSTPSFHDLPSQSKGLQAVHRAASAISLGVQGNGKHNMMGSQLSEFDALSTQTQFHSLSSTTSQNLAKRNLSSPRSLSMSANNTRKDALGAPAASLDTMAETWHQQIQSLHYSSPLRKNISHTYPPSHQPSVFRELPRREPAMILWPESPSVPQKDSSQSETRRHTLSHENKKLSDTWWMEPTRQAKDEPSTNNAEVDSGDHSPPVPNEVALLPVDANQNIKVAEDNSVDAANPKIFPSGIEKAIRAGLKKVISRKQGSSPLLPSPSPDLTTFNQNLAAPELKTPNRSTTSLSKNNGIRIGGQENEVPAPKQETMDTCAQNSEHAEPPATPNTEYQDLAQDIDSVIRILINAESNPQTSQDKPDKETVQVVPELPLPLSVPSTPIANAYAEVRAFISNAMGFDRRERPVSPVSSYQDAKSHHANDTDVRTAQEAVQKEAKPATQVTTSKSLESIAVKSDTAHAKHAPTIDAAAARYMTWNGRTRAKKPLLNSTVQFTAELEDVFQGRKENSKAFKDSTLRPMLAQHN